MATVGSETTTAGESRPRPALIGSSEMEWGPAPDVFPGGAQFCVVYGDPAASTAFTVRLKVSQRYVFAPHSHPHDEHVTVIFGRMQVGNGETVDQDGGRVLEAGDYAFLPKEQFHYACALDDDTVFQVNAIGPFGITYARAEDDPRSAKMH